MPQAVDTVGLRQAPGRIEPRVARRAECGRGSGWCGRRKHGIKRPTPLGNVVAKLLLKTECFVDVSAGVASPSAIRPARFGPS